MNRPYGVDAMKCERCGGSVIEMWDDGPFGQRLIPKCIMCGQDNGKGGGMAEMTEEQKEARREFQRKWRAGLSEEKKEERRQKARDRYQKRKGGKAAKKAWTTRRAAPTAAIATARVSKDIMQKWLGSSTTGPNGENVSILSAEQLLSPAKFLRLELVYQLAGVKIIKE